MMTVHNDVRTYFERVLNMIHALEAENRALEERNRFLEEKNRDLEEKNRALEERNHEPMSGTYRPTSMTPLRRSHMFHGSKETGSLVNLDQPSQARGRTPGRVSQHPRSLSVPRVLSQEPTRPVRSAVDIQQRLNEEEHCWLKQFIETLTINGKPTTAVQFEAEGFVKAYGKRLKAKSNEVVAECVRTGRDDLAEVVRTFRPVAASGQTPFIQYGFENDRRRMGVNGKHNKWLGALTASTCTFGSLCHKVGCGHKHQTYVSAGAFMLNWNWFKQNIVNAAEQYLAEKQEGLTRDVSDSDSDSDPDFDTEAGADPGFGVGVGADPEVDEK